jgi:predicted HTH transcriptional regulator
MSNPDFETPAEKSVADIINLPDDQRQLVNWITHQQKVTASEVATHTNQTEEVTQEQLQSLVSQGFIQEINDSGSVYYQPRFVGKQKSRLSQKIWDKL